MKIDVNYPTLRESNIPGLSSPRRGKVRDIYDFGNLMFVTTDRISTHDVVYGDCVPHKGFGLTQTTIYAFGKTKDIAPNHLISSPDPNVMLVRKLQPYPVEVIVRGVLTGSAWKSYEKTGEVCGIKLPKGMKKNQLLEEPIVTPTTKAEAGHDKPLTYNEAGELIGPVWDEIAKLSIRLYQRGDELASARGGKLVDTKFEWGRPPVFEGEPVLMDEALTHDSSRYVMTGNWQDAFEKGVDPVWIDKQLVRDYAESLGFTGDGPAPKLPEDILRGAAERVLSVYWLLSGEELRLPAEPPSDERIVRNLQKVGLL